MEGGQGMSIIIQGTYSGHLHEGVMEWECPFTDEPKWCQGEFDCDGEYYIHKVTDDDNKVIYIVKAI